MREITQEVVRLRCDFFGVQAEVVGESEEIREQRLRLVLPADDGQSLREPECAADERPLFAGDSVISRISVQ